MKRLVFFVSILHVLLYTNALYGQRWPFENFNVERGLSQSQVTAITQDVRNYLWVGTMGGLNRFDGVKFQNFSRKDGINSNMINCLYSAKDGKVWIGTSRGITYYDGYRFVNLTMTEIKDYYGFASFAEDKLGNIYALEMKNGVFEYSDNHLKRINPPVTKAFPTCMLKDEKGSVWVYFLHEGFFQIENGRWIKQFSLHDLKKDEFVTKVIINKSALFALTNKSCLLKISNGKIVKSVQFPNRYLSSLVLDNYNQIWLATSQGVMLIDVNDLSTRKVLKASNGLSENLVFTIFKDNDQNLWIGTDADGFFKYSGGGFQKIDKTSGLKGNVVMGFARDNRQGILIATREGGLLRYFFQKSEIAEIDYSKFSNRGVNCVGSDSMGNVFIGTMDNRLLQLTGGRIREIKLEKRGRPGIYTIKPYDNKMLIHASSGAYWLQDGKVNKIEGINAAINSIRLNDGRILIGNDKGVVILENTGKVVDPNLAALKNISISAFALYKEYVVIGSVEEGMFFWDMNRNKVFPCSKEEGLADNNVFAILKDSTKTLWVGTSSGVQTVSIGTNGSALKIKHFNVSDGYESSETNLNAIYEDEQHNIWIGTTKGAFIFNENLKYKSSSIKPVAIVEAIDYNGISDQPLKHFVAWEKLPMNPEIKYRNNRISFSCKGIFLRNPANLKFSYFLEGYDEKFSKPGLQTSLNYYNLPPGKYVFNVKTITPDGTESMAYRYPFTIITPFYKTIWFLILMVLCLILCGALIQLAITIEKRKRRLQLKKIREEEQQKIREQTAEDFHDELGNKLTRISVLTDVLQTKTDPENSEVNNLIGQIRSNALALYAGTREILWSLSNESQNLIEILRIIRQTGIELFKDTNINFSFEGIDLLPSDVKVPSGYSRNIIMIFKELLTNAIRHSNAKKIELKCAILSGDIIQLIYCDDGKGFEMEQAKGNGINNIKRRTAKINGTIDFSSCAGAGTKCLVSFKSYNVKK